ncbi:MAG TPA: protein kinase [Acidobacteriota bacterium]|nr:protein kinase [Acidobacteriota bacterium]
MPRESAFISHSSEDSEAALQVEATLRELGLQTVRDQELDPREAAPKAIGKAISSHDLMVVVWSQHAAKSKQVEFEWNAAIALNKTIIPCLLDQTPLKPSLVSFPGVSFKEWSDSVSQILAAPHGPSGGEEQRSKVLERLDTIPPSDQEAMFNAGTLLMQQSIEQQQVDSGADTIVNLPPEPEKKAPEGTTRAGSDEDHSQTDPFGEGMTVAGRYRIRKLLGQGGMGAVYHAYDNALQREVALKVIKPEIANQPEMLERFKREIQLSSVVTHRNVLRVYDLGEAEGVTFLTMQYVDGENLSELLKREGKLSQTVLGVFRQICEGLKAAHEQGVIHRDLKPDNVMIDSSGQVLLTDFGLAKSMQQTAMTQAGQLMGTPDYMSPEQVKGEEIDERSDIYSLGAMLYQMAAGRVPFSGHTVFEVMIQRTVKPPAAVTTFNPDVPPFLEDVIARCMAREKEARYASVDELLADLDRGMETGRSSFGGRFFLRRLGSLKKALRSKRVWIAAPALVLLVVAATFLVLNLGILNEPPPAASLEPMNVLIADFANETGERVFQGTIEQALSIGLEGSAFLESFRRERARDIAAQLNPDLDRLDQEAARLVAQREGIDVVVSGRIARSGDSYSISLQAVDAFSGDVLDTEQARAASREEVLEAVGTAAVGLRRALGDRASEAEMRASVETFTSNSLEAAQAYARAQEVQQQGRWQEAINYYKSAVELDPEMGRAYSGLAVMNFNLGNHEEADRYFLLAMSHLDRMTPRERYRTRGNYYILHRDFEKAVEAYSALVEEVPGDRVGRANLAYAAFFAREFENAYEQGKAMADANPGNVVMRANSAWYAMFAGDLETAESEALKALELDDSFEATYVYLALTKLAQGDVEEARRTWLRLSERGEQGASTAAAGLADLAAYEGRFRDALDILQNDLARENPALPGLKRIAMASAYIQLGEEEPALLWAERALTNTRKLGVIFQAGLVYLRAGQFERAAELAERLSSSLQIEEQAYGKLLEAEAQRLQENVQQAIRTHREAQRLADTVMGRFLLGLAYLDGEAFPSAYSEFEACLNRRGEFTALFLDETPTYRYFPPVHFYMAQAQEGLGSPAAAASYQKFVDIRGQGYPDSKLSQALSKLSP